MMKPQRKPGPISEGSAVQYESEMTIQEKCKNTEFSFNKYTMNLITT